ncbi:hypothetical protein [Klebsiella variicola]|uniref:hypothetical protein n=1 Tax=Klebsiella variicola TaxID=244366 RepID=UPI00312E6636
MTDITELALITKIKKQLENFDTVILKEDEALALVEALEAKDKQIADYAGRLNRLEKRCDHKGSVYWDASGVKRCARCGFGIKVEAE